MWDGGSARSIIPFHLWQGDDHRRGPKVHSFGSTQSYFPDVPVGAETIRTIVWVCLLSVPPLFPPHNHLWGSARTGRSSPNPCAQREKVSLLINPSRTGRTDLSNVWAVSGPSIRTIARPTPLRPSAIYSYRPLRQVCGDGEVSA